MSTTARTVWQKVIAQGKQAFDSERLSTLGVEQAKALDDLFSHLQEKSIDTKLAAVPTSLRDPCRSDLPAIAAELQQLEEESNKCTGKKIEEILAAMQKFFEPHVNRSVEEGTKFFQALWTSAGDDMELEVVPQLCSPESTEAFPQLCDLMTTFDLLRPLPNQNHMIHIITSYHIILYESESYDTYI